MGRIIKYNREKTGGGRVMTYNNTPSTGYPTNDGYITSEKYATLWGNTFTGTENLDGTMLVNGDIKINFDVEDADAYFDEGDDVPTGSLYVSGKIESTSTYGKTLYLNYPTVDGTKTNVLDILKGYDTRITNNTNNISNLTTRLTNVENHQKNQDVFINANTNEIINLKTSFSECHTNCMNNSNEINNLKELIELLQLEIEELKNGSQGGTPSLPTTHTVQVKLNTGVEKIELSGAINETLTNKNLTSLVEDGKTVTYRATASSNYTFGAETGTRIPTKSETLTIRNSTVISPSPILWKGEEAVDKPLTDYLTVEVGCYMSSDYYPNYEIWVRVTSAQDNVSFSLLTTEGNIDWYSLNAGGAKHDFGGNPTITKNDVIDKQAVKQNNTYSSIEWPDPVGRNWTIQFSTGYSNGTFSGTVRSLGDDPSNGKWSVQG